MGIKQMKKETKPKNKKSKRPEIIEGDEIEKSKSKGLIRGTE